MDTKVLDKINHLERTYCRGCMLKEVNRTEGSKSSAHWRHYYGNRKN